MKKSRLIIILSLMVLLTSCQMGPKKDTLESKDPNQKKYTMTFFDTFDTLTNVMVYSQSQEEAEKYGQMIHERFLELHKYYDKYNSYPDVVNIYSLNQKAGQGPVKVSKEIMDLLVLSKDRYQKYGQTNIAIGSLTEVWSKYRDGHEIGAEFEDKSTSSPKAQAMLPPMEELKEAVKHCNIEDVVLDPQESTVEIKDPKLRLDLGAVAKGYATEVIANEMEEAGLRSALISAGGNVRIIGKPPEMDRDYFGVGIQNPDAIYPLKKGADAIKDTVYLNESSVVSSGDYQRFYLVNGKAYHHLIDPATLMPADYYRSVSIVGKDSGLCDFLSTAAFCLPYEKSKALIESIDGIEGYWIHKDGSVTFTHGLKDHLKSQGATNRE